MSQRPPDLGSQHHSRGVDRAPADWSSSIVALPMDSLADEPLGRRCSAAFAFCRHAIVPSALSGEGIWESFFSQPIRRCITYLLPAGSATGRVPGTWITSSHQESGRFPTSYAKRVPGLYLRAGLGKKVVAASGGWPAWQLPRFR